MKYVIPQKLLDYFVNDALKNKAGKKLLKTLAFGVGQLKDDCIILEEIIYPTQTSTDVSVEDSGMNTYHINYNGKTILCNLYNLRN